ncbi:hypothetical protein ZIOFF_032114 [Zingiber officinale]|uniref:Uncharacterized protein n=1 Tax=Zingiber officinale TaxID=94328 RepID=A0A8J5GUX6_ZINOF|nr:hypothetical protein ZIOFF_032114 [Zingiber officinale]
MAASLQSTVILSNCIDPYRRLFASPARSLPGTKGSISELNSKDKAWHAEDFLRFQVFLGRILCNSSVELGGVTMFPNDGDFNVVSQMMERFESSKLISNLSLACCAFYQLSELVIFLELVTGFEELKLLWKGGPSPLIIDPMVIEDMSIQVNVPALAMEEVAPLAVSDAAMLAPEEIFHGKGNIKEEAELTKEERKRRRANQKRRFRRLKGIVFEDDLSVGECLLEALPQESPRIEM